MAKDDADSQAEAVKKLRQRMDAQRKKDLAAQIKAVGDELKTAREDVAAAKSNLRRRRRDYKQAAKRAKGDPSTAAKRELEDAFMEEGSARGRLARQQRREKALRKQLRDLKGSA